MEELYKLIMKDNKNIKVISYKKYLFRFFIRIIFNISIIRDFDINKYKINKDFYNFGFSITQYKNCNYLIKKWRFFINILKLFYYLSCINKVYRIKYFIIPVLRIKYNIIGSNSRMERYLLSSLILFDDKMINLDILKKFQKESKIFRGKYKFLWLKNLYDRELIFNI